jgi:hypothetical protein
MQKGRKIRPATVKKVWNFFLIFEMKWTQGCQMVCFQTQNFVANFPFIYLFRHTFSVRCLKYIHFETEPGLPDGIFSTKNPNLGKFWRVLQLKMLVYFMVIGSNL